MLDEALAAMLDDIFMRIAKLFAMRSTKMLEVRAEWAHLVGPTVAL